MNDVTNVNDSSGKEIYLEIDNLQSTYRYNTFNCFNFLIRNLIREREFWGPNVSGLTTVE